MLSEIQKRESYICFGDFEFTCGKGIPLWKSEILSVGIVICDSNYRLQEKFYNTCRPVSGCRLTKECMDLTHLTQEEIDNSPDADTVFRDVQELLEKYRIKEVRVWGNYDRPALSCDAKRHKKAKKEFENIKAFSKTVVDIQAVLTKKMELPEAVNIGELSTAFGFVPETGTFHNALNDAMALYTVERGVYTTDFRDNESFRELKNLRIQRIAERRKKAEERRRANEEEKKKTAFSIELSEREHNYYDRLVREEKTDEADYFVFVRLKVINAINEYPDDIYFYILVYNNDKSLKIMPSSEYNTNRIKNTLRYSRFAKGEMGAAVIEECLTRKRSASVHRKSVKANYKK